MNLDTVECAPDKHHYHSTLDRKVKLSNAWLMVWGKGSCTGGEVNTISLFCLFVQYKIVLWGFFMQDIVISNNTPSIKQQFHLFVKF